MITDLSSVITGGLVKRQLGQVDLETGELLKGVTVWVKVKRSPYVRFFNERGYRLNHNYGWKGNVRKLQLVKNRS
jgi:hypothetical protein